MSEQLPDDVPVAAVGHEVELLEFDETVPPRPEEEVADAAREDGPA
jgi:hypothetical protein